MTRDGVRESNYLLINTRYEYKSALRIRQSENYLTTVCSAIYDERG